MYFSEPCGFCNSSLCLQKLRFGENVRYDLTQSPPFREGSPKAADDQPTSPGDVGNLLEFYGQPLISA